MRPNRKYLIVIFGLGLLIISLKPSFSTPLNHCEKSPNRQVVAEAGYADAQFGLGYEYEHCHGETPDYAEAAKWYRKSADQGDARAQYSLGKLYEDGHGVTKDYKRAADLYLKAAGQSWFGTDDSQYAIGLLYANGKGVKQSYTEAIEWWRKSAPMNLDARHALGCLYFRGKGVNKDYAEAVKWWSLDSIEPSGKMYAASYLAGRWYAQGTLQTQHEGAVRLWTVAAEQGNPDAQYDLGRLYADGKWVKQDYEQAYFWMSLPSKVHDPDKAHQDIRDEIARHLTSQQIAGIKRRIQAWTPEPSKSCAKLKTRTLK